MTKRKPATVLASPVAKKSCLCQEENCDKHASCGNPETRKRLYCAKHKKEDMVNVIYTPCAQPGCTVRPYYNTPGEKKGLYCVEHKIQDMINVVDETCTESGCTTRPWYGAP